MGVSQFICLLAFILFFNGVLSKPSSILPKDVTVKQNPKWLQSRELDLDLERQTREYTYNPNYQVYLSERVGFTGLRSVFQWTVGNRSINNFGIQNSMQFQVNDLIPPYSLIFGDIGIQSNGSKIEVSISLETATNSTAGPSFKCASTTPLYTRGHSCFSSNYSLISNGVYFLDVEINNNTISGFISQPQANLSNINNFTLPRSLIGNLTWNRKLVNLTPSRYWIENNYKSCNVSNEISTFNYLPVSFNNTTTQQGSYTYSVLDNTISCGPINSLAMTDWSTIVYISRPSPIINGTKSTIF